MTIYHLPESAAADLELFLDTATNVMIAKSLTATSEDKSKRFDKSASRLEDWLQECRSNLITQETRDGLIRLLAYCLTSSTSSIKNNLPQITIRNLQLLVTELTNLKEAE